MKNINKNLDVLLLYHIFNILTTLYFQIIKNCIL